MFYITGICIFIEIGYLCNECKESKIDKMTVILIGVLGVVLTLAPLFIYSHL